MTTADAHGAPDENDASGLLYDASELGAYATSSASRFVRFDLLLAAGADGIAPGVRLPSLDFVRLALRW